MEISTIHEWVRAAISVGRDPSPACQQPTGSDASLAPFQVAAATEAQLIAARLGGVVLADAVGLGKTRVGLAVARGLLRDANWSTRERHMAYAVVPSRLRNAWCRAALQAGWRLPDELRVLSHAELSRRSFLQEAREDGSPPGVILVDEAHQFRNHKARRARHLAELAALAPVVLVTATPVCNSIWDLYHLLSLFLAEHDLRDTIGMNLKDAFEAAERGAYDLTELLELLVIRRTSAPEERGFGKRPGVRLDVLPYDAGPDESWLWQHLGGRLADMSLVLCRDEWPRGLFVEYVLKRWESGPHALAETLEQLAEYHRRWLEADFSGRTLSRARFQTLFRDDSAYDQGVFTFVYDQNLQETLQNCAQKRKLAAADLALLQDLLQRTRRVISKDSGALAAIWGLLDEPIIDKLLIFTSYQEAARGIFERLEALLGSRGGVGLVTGQEARASGLGRTSAEEIIRRFAPLAAGQGPLAAHQRLDVLVSTDCLSEGINLQDCGRVVLADLPYSPLKVEQRIGRLVRPASAHQTVQVYLPRPRDWNDTLGLRRRLDRKLTQANVTGTGFSAAGVIRQDPAPATPQPTEEIAPLAALTTLDRLAEQLGCEGGDMPDGPVRYFTASVPGHPRQLWVRAIIDDQRPIWCLVRDGGHVELRLPALLRDLITISELHVVVSPGSPCPQMLSAAQDALETRRQFLQATRLAPLPLGLDAPQLVLWKRLRDAELLNQADLDELRDKLLRPFPRGVERQLEALCAAEVSLQHVWRRLKGLDAPRTGRRVSVRIVLGLQMEGVVKGDETRSWSAGF